MSGPADSICSSLAKAGLDLVHFFRPNLLQGFGAPADAIDRASAALLIGNTRALWEPFVSKSNPVDTGRNHPLDGYVERSVRKSLTVARPLWLRFAHEMEPSPIPIQRIASASGFAELGPVGLNIHPQYGPWFALRAVALLPLSSQASERSEPSLCATCDRPCLEAFQEAERHSPDVPVTRRLLPVRDACPVGREYRYSEAQIAYHYDRNELLGA